MSENIHIGGSRATYYRALDGLRGLAIAAVLFFHSAELGAFAYAPIIRAVAGIGWVGVDLFFVLSGFLITKILAGVREGRSTLADYYKNRLLRIGPLYALAIVVMTVLFYGLYGQQREQINLWNSALPYLLTGTQNMLPALGPSVPFGANHLWSLGVELQFYAIWPIAVMWVRPNRMIRLCLTLLVAALALRLFMAFNDASRFNYFATPTRLDGFLVGAIVSRLVAGDRFVRPAHYLAATILGMSVFSLCAARDGQLTPWGPAVANLGLSGVAMCFGGCLGLVLTCGSRVTKAIAHPSIVRLGIISYGLYVIHYPLLRTQNYLATAWFPSFKLGTSLLPDLVFLTLWSSLSLLLAEISFRLLETPFLRMKRPAAMQRQA